jgi:hypothetical protein
LPNDRPSDEIIGGSASQSRRVSSALLLGQSLPVFAGDLKLCCRLLGIRLPLAVEWKGGETIKTQKPLSITDFSFQQKFHI